jgi:aspartate 1-decarboxylase
MQRTMMHSKIHRATITGADMDYVGSLTMDPDLLEEAEMLVNEQVTVVDITNGARIVTYLAEGRSGSGDMIINGAAARLVQRGDLVIVLSYGIYGPEELETYEPRVVHVDRANRVISEEEAVTLVDGLPTYVS